MEKIGVVSVAELVRLAQKGRSRDVVETALSEGRAACGFSAQHIARLPEKMEAARP